MNQTSNEHNAPSGFPRRLMAGARRVCASTFSSVRRSLHLFRRCIAHSFAAARSAGAFVRGNDRTRAAASLRTEARQALVAGVKAVAVVPMDISLGLAEGVGIAAGSPIDTTRARRRAINSARSLWNWSPAVTAVLRAFAHRPVKHAQPGAHRIVMFTISQIDIDPRINKEATSLADAGFEVDIVCFASGTQDVVTREPVRPGVTWVRVPAHGLSGLYFQKALLDAAMHLEFDYVHSHDLTALLVGWCAARRRGVPLIYDAHEMWTENVEFDGENWVGMTATTRRVAGALERLVLRSTSIFITVSPSIEAEYRRRYHRVYPKGPIMVANYPSLDLDQVEMGDKGIHALIGVPDTSFVTLYLGGVNPLRNIEAVIEAHASLPDHCVFVIQGPGIDMYRDDYMALAATLGIEHRIICRSPVARHEVVAMARTADCGVVMLRNLCKNFYWFFPNKLFEYCLAGVPVAVSDFPDVAAFVHEFDCGVTFDPDSPSSIAAALAVLANDREAAREMGARGRRAVLESHNWEQAMAALVDEYRALQK